MTPEPNTDRARQTAMELWCERRYQKPFHDASGELSAFGIAAREAINFAIDCLSDAGLWVGAYPDVPPWMVEVYGYGARRFDGTVKYVYGHYGIGEYDQEPDEVLATKDHVCRLYAIRPSPPEENER